MRYNIKKDEYGIMYDKGEIVKILNPSSRGYCFLNRVVAYKMGSMFHSEENLSVLLNIEELADKLLVFSLAETESALYLQDGVFTRFITKSGKHAVWKGPFEQEIIILDTSDPFIRDERVIKLARKGYLESNIFSVQVGHNEVAPLYINNKFIELLNPGVYYFWKNIQEFVKIIPVTTAKQKIEISGQELMTRDKVSLRINFVVVYQISDIMKFIGSTDNAENQLYVAAQLVLRDYVSAYTLEEILDRKGSVASEVLRALSGLNESMGIIAEDAGIKDVILPGEIKDILNQVLVAEKMAQASIITRREETASTRNLLNTAKLMDENKTLMKLREMEHMEKIAANIQSLTMAPGTNLLEQFRAIFGNKDD